MPGILLVDDEPLFAKGLKRSLESEGYEVTVASDGEKALRQAESKAFDLILLDLMLPKVDGLAVCRTIRARHDVPIIMLTARDDDVDKIVGLELGADDYITKPFNTRELSARIKAVLRRSQRGRERLQADRLRLGPLQVDRERRRVTVSGLEVDLTPTEYALLEILASHPGRVYTRQNLLGLVWGYDFAGDDRTVDVHIRRLRAKVEEDPAQPRWILTRWGIGYYAAELPDKGDT